MVMGMLKRNTFRALGRWHANALQMTGVIAVVLSLSIPTHKVPACTTAVISGRATADGRPILWKNRDTSQAHNEVVLFTDGEYRVLAVVNAGKRTSVLMVVNEA